MSRKHKEGEILCPIYGKAFDEKYCEEECLINDCGMYLQTSSPVHKDIKEDNEKK